MPTLAFYPNQLKMNAQDVWRFDSIETNMNYQFIEGFAGGDPFPCLVSVETAEPEISFTTSSIEQVLLECTTHGIVGDLSGQQVEFIYVAGKLNSIRETAASTKHFKAIMNKTSMIYWTNILAREDQHSTITALIKTIRLQDGTDPMTWQAELPANAGAVCQPYYNLGPVWYDGRLVDSIHEISWDNNIQQYARRTRGYADPDWLSIARYAPVLTAKTTDLNEISHETVLSESTKRDEYGGRPFGGLVFWLRQRRPDGIFHPDNTAKHIRFTVYGGWKGAMDTSGLLPAEATVMFRLHAGTNADGSVLRIAGVERALFEVAFNVKIPTEGATAPVLDVISNMNSAINVAHYQEVAWEGGGFPDTFSATGLPTGITIDTKTGLMSGTATAAATYNVDVTATNQGGAGSDNETFDWVVDP